MGGGRIYVKPFSRLQIGGSIAGDNNEYKGLRDTDDDGYPDEIDLYPEDERYVTEIDYYRDRLEGDPNAVLALQSLIDSGIVSDMEKTDLRSY